jgi:DNA-binding HxlR family transcriptional regulator
MEPRACSIARALDVVGDRWSLLVVRELTLGVHRFNDIAGHTGAPRDVLTARLRKLEELNVVERRQYSDRPPRYEYLLTASGRELAPVLQLLRQWGDDHAADGPPPVSFQHNGHQFVPVVHCEHCGEIVEHGTISRKVHAETHAAEAG